MTHRQRWVVLIVVYGLFLAIGLAALAAVLGWVPNASQRFKDWAVVALFADLAAAGVAVFKTQFQSREARVFVNVLFDGVKPADVDLKDCTYEVYDGELQSKKKGQASVQRGPGGWQCQFSWPAEASDTAQLRLVEHSGRAWRIQSFSPTTVEQQALRVP